MGGLEIFGIRIKTLREKMNMSQKDFSNYIGIKQQTLSGYERGVIRPSLDIATDIAKKCNISIDWLCGLSEKETLGTLPSNYADVIDLLLNLKVALDFDIDGDNVLFIHNFLIEIFLSDWSKTYDLYKDGVIDKNLYELWITQQKQLYSRVTLDDEEAFETLVSEMVSRKALDQN